MRVSAIYIPEIPPPTTTTSQDRRHKEDSLKEETKKRKRKWKVEEDNNAGYSQGVRPSWQNKFNNNNNDRSLLCNALRTIFAGHSREDIDRLLTIYKSCKTIKDLKFEICRNSRRPMQRLTLESWYTNLEQTPLNRCQQLPAPYKRLIHDRNETDKRTSNRPT